jgi:Domain of unknown function (DUF4397)
MKQVLAILITACAIAAFSSCSKSSSAPANSAKVMFFNGCASGATAISVNAKVNGALVNGASNIALDANSGYQYVTAGTADSFLFMISGLTNLTGGSASIVANASYTAFAGGFINAPTFLLVSDDLSAPTTGYAKVRFVNLSGDNMAESCYIGTGTAKLDSNLTLNQASPFFQIPAVSGASVFMIPSNPTLEATLANQNFASGKIYTVVLTGTSSGSGSSVLTLTVLNNN